MKLAPAHDIATDLLGLDFGRKQQCCAPPCRPKKPVLTPNKPHGQRRRRAAPPPPLSEDGCGIALGDLLSSGIASAPDAQILAPMVQQPAHVQNQGNDDLFDFLSS